MFPEAENTFRSDFCSLSGCHSVCLEPQNSQSEAARLTCLGLQDCLVGAARLTILKAFLLVFDNQQARQKKETSHIMLNVNNIHKKAEKQQIIAVKPPHGRPDGFYSDFFMSK